MALTSRHLLWLVLFCLLLSSVPTSINTVRRHQRDRT